MTVENWGIEHRSEPVPSDNKDDLLNLFLIDLMKSSIHYGADCDVTLMDQNVTEW